MAPRDSTAKACACSLGRLQCVLSSLGFTSTDTSKSPMILQPRKAVVTVQHFSKNREAVLVTVVMGQNEGSKPWVCVGVGAGVSTEAESRVATALTAPAGPQARGVVRLPPDPEEGGGRTTVDCGAALGQCTMLVRPFEATVAFDLHPSTSASTRPDLRGALASAVWGFYSPRLQEAGPVLLDMQVRAPHRGQGVGHAFYRAVEQYLLRAFRPLLPVPGHTVTLRAYATSSAATGLLMGAGYSAGDGGDWHYWMRLRKTWVRVRDGGESGALGWMQDENEAFGAECERRIIRGEALAGALGAYNLRMGTAVEGRRASGNHRKGCDDCGHEFCPGHGDWYFVEQWHPGSAGRWGQRGVGKHCHGCMAARVAAATGWRLEDSDFRGTMRERHDKEQNEFDEANRMVQSWINSKIAGLRAGREGSL